MKRKNAIYYFLICLLFLFILACDISTNSSEDDQISQKELELKLTEVALQVTQTAMAVPVSTEKEQHEAALPDSEEESGNGSEDEIPCNSSRMVSESIPDGTNFQAGETFTKSWTLKNAGVCNWTTDYKFVFESGDQMGASSSINVPSVIEPGRTVTFRINMTAPTADGDYTGVWRLKAADGEKMGKYWANIAVGSTGAGTTDPSPPDNKEQAFAITRISSDLKEDYAGFCPFDINYHVFIEANGAGTAKIASTVDFSETQIDTEYTFTQAGTRTFDGELRRSDGGDFWIKYIVKEPKYQEYIFNYSISCLF